MATRVTDGARRERHEKRESGCHPRFARLAASPLPRARIALTKSEEKERLLAVNFYIYCQKVSNATVYIHVSGDISCSYPFCQRKFQSQNEFASSTLKHHLENPGNWHERKGNISNNETFT